MTNTRISVKFNGVTYFKVPTAKQPEGAYHFLSDMTGPQLVELYNLVNAQNDVAARRVTRFKDNGVAQRRTWDALDTYQTIVDAEAEAFVMSDAELAAQKPRQDLDSDSPVVEQGAADLPATAAPVALGEIGDGVAIISDADKAQIAAEAKAPKPKMSDALMDLAVKTKREPRTPGSTNRKPKADDGKLKMPSDKKMARRQKDGSYTFRVAPAVPRTEKVSDQREELLGMIVAGDATWAKIKAAFGKDDFRTVTTITMFCISLGYGLETQEDGTLKLIEPLAA